MAYHALPELLALERPADGIRIPPGETVPVTPRVRALVDTPPLRRLARISQLGLVALVYPGATHSRFEHSLGVYRLALEFLARLRRDPVFDATVGEDDAAAFIVAALVHDVGHWAYCHPLEDIGLAGLPRHESLVAGILAEEQIAAVLSRHWGLDPRRVADLARQLAMQVVANNARFVRRDDVSADVVAKEKEIALEFTKSEADKAIDEAKRVVEDYRGQLIEQKAANNAEAIAELEKRIVVSEKQVIAAESRKKGQLSNIEKIVAGRVDKFFAEACLLEQSFFRDPEKKVSDLLTEAKGKVGEEVSIVRFVRFQVGETAAE